MTARVVLQCDGQEGVYPCRQAIPVGAVVNAAHARRIAACDGWTHRLRKVEGVTCGVLDLCPRCSR